MTPRCTVSSSFASYIRKNEFTYRIHKQTYGFTGKDRVPTRFISARLTSLAYASLARACKVAGLRPIKESKLLPFKGSLCTLDNVYSAFTANICLKVYFFYFNLLTKHARHYTDIALFIVYVFNKRLIS